MDSMQLARNRFEQRSLVNGVTNILVLWKVGIL
jgi:hypothetical protein